MRVWDFSDDPESRQRLSSELERSGHALVRPRLRDLAFDRAARAPWRAARLLFGDQVTLVEQQPIAPVLHGTSFASTCRETPLHTDSQTWRGTMPNAQLMFCGEAAPTGGDTLLVDGWQLLQSLEARDPTLFSALFDTVRDIPFVFGNVRGTSVSLRRGALTLVHSPQPARDSLSVRWKAAVDAAPRITRPVRANELLVVDNLRMLHGRTAFRGERSFTRLLTWLRAPLGRHPRYELRASEATYEICEPQSAWDRTLRQKVVLQMLNGEAPGILARRHGIDEAELYAWRDQTLIARQ